MPDGTQPTARGWNPQVAAVDDLEAPWLYGLQALRNDIVTARRRQILLEDPSGNPIELFEPTRPEARLSRSGRAVESISGGQ